MTKEFRKDKLAVKVMPTRTEMGQVAAQDIHGRILALLAEKDEINMIFAAAPSQNDVLKSLTEYADIPWNRINACHMDEYIGLDKSAPQGFGNFLKAHIFDLVSFKSVNLIDCSAKDPEAESERYAEILKKFPTDVVVMGIGENGHIAFNDPPVADFNDPKGCLKDSDIVVKDACAATVIVASGGYPGAYEKGMPISGLPSSVSSPSSIVFHCGTKAVPSPSSATGAGTVVTTGGRVLSVTGMGATLREAVDRAYAAVGKISFEGMFYRKDIAHRAFERS